MLYPPLIMTSLILHIAFFMKGNVYSKLGWVPLSLIFKISKTNVTKFYEYYQMLIHGPTLTCSELKLTYCKLIAYPGTKCQSNSTSTFIVNCVHIP